MKKNANVRRKPVQIPDLEERVLKLAQQNGRDGIWSRHLMRVLNIHSSTASRVLEKLEHKGHLTSIKAGKTRLYVLTSTSRAENLSKRKERR